MGTRVLTHAVQPGLRHPRGARQPLPCLGGRGRAESGVTQLEASACSPSLSLPLGSRPTALCHKSCQCFAPAPRSVTVKASGLGVRHSLVRGWRDVWRERASLCVLGRCRAAGPRGREHVGHGRAAGVAEAARLA